MKTSLSGKIWKMRGKKIPHEKISTNFFRIRGFTKEDLKTPHLSDFLEIQDLPYLKEATQRIFSAIQKNEKILLFGDFDLDGASGVAVLFFALKKIGAHITPKLPSRNEGYGLSKEVFESAKKEEFSLVITVDCGASNSEEVAYGNSLGIDTIITDHHSLASPLPPAVAVVHPHHSEPNSELWHLTGAGVAFFLAKKLLETHFSEKNLKVFLAQLLEITVLGTVADVGKLVGANRAITNLGLQQLQKTTHPGLKKLLECAKISAENLNTESIAFFLAPRLNAAGRLNHPHLALRLLLGDASAATDLERLNSERREITNTLFLHAESLLGNEEIPPAIILFSEEFFSGVSGLLAAKFAEKYARPAIICAPEKGKITASCRGPEDFHLANALRESMEFLEKCGGHSCAAGFSMLSKNLEPFKQHFCEKVESLRGKNPPSPFCTADFSVSFTDLFAPDFEDIFAAAPFGEGNPAPTFLLKKITFQNPRAIGADKSHFSATLSVGGNSADVVFFHGITLLPQEKWGNSFDLLVNPEFSSFRGERKLRIKIKDIRPSS